MSASNVFDDYLRFEQDFLRRARADARTYFNNPRDGVGPRGTGKGRQFSQSAITYASTTGVAGVIDLVIIGVSQTTGDIQRGLAEFGTELAKVQGRRTGIKKAHERVAAHAQEAVIHSYLSQVGRRTPPRTKKRLHGQMMKALQNKGFITSSTSSINFGNINMLYSVAPHWRRLNFGAGARGNQTKPKSFNFTFVTGGRGGHLQIPHNPGPSFWMPAGAFFDGDDFSKPLPFDKAAARSEGGPGGNFYPHKMIPKRFKEARRFSRSHAASSVFYTRGIKGYQFFDTGIKVIAKELPEEYLRLSNQWYRDSSPSRRKTVNVKVR